jgi:hypothetical protein
MLNYQRVDPQKNSTFANASHLAGQGAKANRLVVHHRRLARRLQCSAAGVRLGWCNACNATGGRCEAGKLELRCVLARWEVSATENQHLRNYK